jgi:hypothetical protein
MNTFELETADIVSDAIELIKKFGWHQFSFGSKDVGYCLVGAISVANKGTWGRKPESIYRVIEKMISDQSPTATVTYSLSKWNDEKGRTKRQVLAILRKAEKELRAAS